MQAILYLFLLIASIFFHDAEARNRSQLRCSSGNCGPMQLPPSSQGFMQQGFQQGIQNSPGDHENDGAVLSLPKQTDAEYWTEVHEQEAASVRASRVAAEFYKALWEQFGKCSEAMTERQKYQKKLTRIVAGTLDWQKLSPRERNKAKQSLLNLREYFFLKKTEFEQMQTNFSDKIQHLKNLSKEERKQFLLFNRAQYLSRKEVLQERKLIITEGKRTSAEMDSSETAKREMENITKLLADNEEVLKHLEVAE